MRQVRFSIFVVILFLVSAPLFAADYVLSAGKWGNAQASAVAAAGGTVRYAHSSGFALVSSDAADFAARVNAGKAFNEVLGDQVAQWQGPVRTSDVQESAVTPGDETFAAAQWAPTAVNAQGAWAAGYTGAGVRVAVLDGGIYNSHIDLNGNVDVARSVSFVPGFAFNQDVGTFWHGTHVAGIIAAKDNAIGTIGIAPAATIVGVKVLHNGSGSFGAIIAGLYYASTPIAQGGGGADIINMSLGAEFDRRGGAGSLLGPLAKAVNYAASQGVLVVSAAGNSGVDLGQARDYVSVPAESGSGIAVSASGPLGFALGATDFHRPASYSNYGEGAIWVAGPGGDFALPGTAICALPRQPAGTIVQQCWVFDMVMSTVRGSGASISSYSWAAGTSMAAPAVAGVAALAKQAHPGISLGALKSLISRSADSESPRQFYGHGYPNAGNAVQ
jgi:subtilisin family serine protease